jgi:DNA repair exonuclease SbcCD nuclease subunit
MKILLIGDMHVQSSNLEDTAEIFKLIDQILVDDNQISAVCLLGDIFHTHNIVKQEPAFFVRSQIEKIINKFKKEDRQIRWVALAGNHDFSTPSAVYVENAVRMVLGDLIEVVDDEPLNISDFSFLPFIGDNEKFIQVCNSLPKTSIVVCHQTFDGSRYENNQTAPHGVNQNDIPQKIVISGHIHTKQNLKNNHNEIAYVGTPRALNSNETNQEKFLTVYDSVNNKFQLHSTDHLVKCFKAFYIRQGDDNLVVDMQWKPKDDVRIHVSGNEEFYEKVLEINKELLGKVQFIPDIRKELSKVLDIESGKYSMDQALHKYVHEIYDMSDELKGSVWKKLQNLMPQLGNN